MVSLPRSKAIIDLGKRLVEQLNDDGDLAAAWLSHLLAERIVASEQAEGDQKVAAEDACVKLILELWNKRNDFNDHHRPLRDMDSIVRTLASLDVERVDHRYFSNVLRGPAANGVPEPARQWLEFATELDTTAKTLIRLALAKAVEAMGPDAQAWTDLAAEAAVEEPAETLIVRFVSPGHSDDDWERQARRREIKSLREFIALSEGLADSLQAKLDVETPPDKPN